MDDVVKNKKSLGQNFLNSRTIKEKIIQVSNLNKDDQILEIGPGRGQITFDLAERVKKIVAIEKDEKLSHWLKLEIINRGIKNIEIIEGDILDVSPLDYRDFKIVANLPYYITGRFLKKFLPHRRQPTFLMLQKEVAQRLISREPQNNILSLATQFYGIAKILFRVPATAFTPQPKVDSAFLKIEPNLQPRGSAELFFKVVKFAFASKRQTLLNNLTRGLKQPKAKIENILKSLNISTKSRAQELSLEDYIRISHKIPKTF